MAIIIKRNDYKQPREVRIEIVKKVCDCIVDMLDKDMDDYQLIIYGEHPELYFGEIRDNYPNSNMKKRVLLNKKANEHCYVLTRIRSCEMRVVFKVMQDYGYYIHKRATNDFKFSKLPYLFDKKAERITFDFFID